MAVLNFLSHLFNSENLGEHSNEYLKKISSQFCMEMMKRWKKHHRILKNFLSANSKWIDSEIILSEFSCHSKNTSRGRPVKAFEECDVKTKKRKVQPLLEYAPEQLSLATQLSLRSQGKRDAAAVVKEVSQCSSQRATKIKKKINSTYSGPKKFTKEKALALYMDMKMTKSAYCLLRKETKKHAADIYPRYEVLLEAKKQCYPEDCIITDISAEINLQSLLDHTVKRLFEVLCEKESLFQDFVNVSVSEGAMIYKWGCDGAAGHSNYKQKFCFPNNGNEICNPDDSFLFSLSVVPLELVVNNRQVWNNPTPSSTKYCRPIKLIFKRETTTVIKEEVRKVEQQIKELSPTKISLGESELLINHTLLLTMVDGKVCGSLCDQSSQKCYLCGATPKEMNNLERNSVRPVEQSRLSFGLSPLHAKIRCFECLLHIAYRLEVRSWQVKKNDKEKVDTRKKSLQKKFREQMGLLVDIPKQGTGTTNDGNTARAFFSQPSLAAKITGLNETLIRRFAVILSIISCGEHINSTAFDEYALETAKLYIQEYNWYYMPPTLHKLLIHGGAIISSLQCPIGTLSEEAQEALNKISKKFRESHTRKCDRTKTMEDLIHMLLINSDPLITSKRNILRKKKEVLTDEMRSLLTISSVEEDSDDDADGEEILNFNSDSE